MAVKVSSRSKAQKPNKYRQQARRFWIIVGIIVVASLTILFGIFQAATG